MADNEFAVENFDLKIRMSSALSTKDKEGQKSLLQKSAKLITEILDEGLQQTDTERSIELNVAVLKLKHVIKKKGIPQ